MRNCSPNKKKAQKVKNYRYFLAKKNYKLIIVVVVSYKMSAYVRKLQFVNFYKLHFPLRYNPEIGMKLSECEYHSLLTDFYVKNRRLVNIHSI